MVKRNAIATKLTKICTQTQKRAFDVAVQGHDLNVFLTFYDTIFTLKEWFLSKKGPKEGERVARGHFHERVGESPVHWLPPGVGFTQKAFSVSENGPFENFLRSNSIFI